MVFKKGKSGNLKGRPPDALCNKIKRLTKDELEDIVSIIIQGTPEDLNKILRDPSSSLIKLAILSVVKKIIAKGDMDSLDKLLNRMIGKVSDKVDLKGDGFMPTTVMLNIPANGREEIK